MNNDWYNNEGWYRPLNQPVNQAAANQSAAQKPRRKPFYKRPIFYIGIGLAVLMYCIFFLVLMMNRLEASPYFDDFGDIPEYSIDDVMPDDFRDYLDNYYTSTTGTQAEIYLPKVDDRGSLKLSIADGDSDALTLQELYDQCTPSIVYVKAEKQDGTAYSWGTGIIVSADGYIITNTHVIDKCVNAEIGLTDGSTYEAKLVGADSVSDIAILKIDAQGLTPAVFAESDTVNIGDAAIAIGNPLGEKYRLTMTNGIISAKDRSVNYNGAVMNLLQTNAAINEGNSGGPLFNDRGQVVGITNMKIISADSGVEGIGFAIPTDTIKSILSSLMADGAVYGRITIGITVGAIPEEVSEYYGIPRGLYISNVDSSSDAAKQGVKAGDIITAANGQEVFATADLAGIKDSMDVGDTITFSIWRDGETLEIDVKLMDANDIYN
ncbi:MAG: trypsin-like peptidase domain-containing protein [Bacillota bacterium]|nr:trypsin-like peptidase domain-containing protein [Bacillota bacterium]